MWRTVITHRQDANKNVNNIENKVLCTDWVQFNSQNRFTTACLCSRFIDIHRARRACFICSVALLLLVILLRRSFATKERQSERKTRWKTETSKKKRWAQIECKHSSWNSTKSELCVYTWRTHHTFRSRAKSIQCFSFRFAVCAHACLCVRVSMWHCTLTLLKHIEKRLLESEQNNRKRQEHHKCIDGISFLFILTQNGSLINEVLAYIVFMRKKRVSEYWYYLENSIYASPLYRFSMRRSAQTIH